MISKKVYIGVGINPKRKTEYRSKSDSEVAMLTKPTLNKELQFVHKKLVEYQKKYR